MKRQIKKRIQKSMRGFFAIVLSITLVMTYSVTGFAAAGQTLHASGSIATMMSGEITKIAAGAIDRAVLAGLGKAASMTEDTPLQTVFNATRKILGGGQTMALQNILKACAQIQAQISQLDATVRSASAHTDSLIAKLNVEIAQNDFSGEQKKLRSFRDKYEGVVNTFSDLTAALDKYCTDAGKPDVSESTLADDIFALKAAYNNVEKFCNSASETAGMETTSVNFVDDLTAFLELTSPYPATRAIKEGEDLSDSKNWGSRNSSEKTYLDYAHSFYETQIAGEHQMYDLMSASMSEAAAPLISFLTAYSMYAGYKANKICTDPGYTDKETERQAQIQDIWTKYYTAQNRAIRGFYQMNSLYENDLLRLMRGYDTSQRLNMRYKSEEEHTVRDGLIGNNDETLHATDATGEYRNFYIIKPYGAGSVYAVSKWSGQNIFSDQMAYEYSGWQDEHCVSQDYFNLQRTNDDGRDRGFRTIGTGAELADLTSTNAWMLSGYFLDNYLRGYAGFDDIPDLSAYHQNTSNNKDTLKAGTFAILNDSRWDNNVWNDSKDNRVTFLNVSMKMEASLTANEVELDTNDLDEEMDSTPLYIIMRNSEALSRSVSLESEGARTEVYDGENKILDNSGSRNVNSGNTLELRIYPDSGKVVDKIELFGADGDLIDTPFDSTEIVEDPDSGTSTTFDTGSTLYNMDDGGYMFKLSAPYQNSLIRVSCKGEAPREYSAELESAMRGDLQFESHMGLPMQSFHAGDTVTVYARPYRGCILDGISVKDAETGKDLNIAVSKADADVYFPSEKAYSFKMPAQDVSISGSFQEGHIVSFAEDHFVKDDNGKTICRLVFDDSAQTDGPGSAELAFLPGSEAAFTNVCDKEYFFDSIKAVGVKTGKEYEVKDDGDGHFSVAVGSEDILVTPEYVKKDGRNVATIIDDYPPQGRLAFFADEKGSSIEKQELLYAPGSIIVMNINDERLYTCNFSVTDAEGKDISLSVDMLPDEELGIMTLKMPDKDIFIHVPEVHNYVNGICRDKDCGHYQNPLKNEDGVYQIANAGNLFWLSSLVRGDRTHASFADQDQAPKAVLVNDIDLESRQWEPFVSFSGTLDGDHHLIDNFYIHVEDDPSGPVYSGMFTTMGSAVVRDFSIKGKAELEYKNKGSKSLHFGTIAGNAQSQNDISHIYSYVDIEASSAGESKIFIGGIASVCYTFSDITGCVNFGSISGSFKEAAGIANSMAKSTILDCANIGTITQTDSSYSSVVGGLCLDGIEPDRADVDDSYNYGKLTGSGSTSITTVINDGKKNYADNCYYLDTSSSDTKRATPKDAAQFKSGEAGWLLNKGVTDGTQGWYQNIDNGRTPDAYPLPDDTRGTIYYIEGEGRYSNYPDGLSPEKPKEFAIKTYDDLVEFARLVNEEYPEWKDAKAWLENNIVAPKDSVWEAGIASVSEDTPFNGSFDGNGYCIAGLNVKGGETGGLFGWIGESGSVRNVNLYDCDYEGSAAAAGGIAAVNEGTIEYCVNGVNLTNGVYVKPEDGSLISMKEFNSVINGDTAGGIAAENNGTIYACRVSAEINISSDTSAAGSIAGKNTGTISNCAGNSTISAGGGNGSFAGGLSGTNSGSIKGGYSSALIKKSGSAAAGSLSGSANKGSFTDAFYTTSEDQTPYGSGTPAEESNITGLRRGEMMNDSFLDQLEGTGSNSVTWVRDNALNAGLPRIAGKALNYGRARYRSGGVNVSGVFHSAAEASVVKLSKGSEAWNLMLKAADGRSAVDAYSFSLKDASGARIPSELWAQSDIFLTVPSGAASVSIVLMHPDGTAELTKPLISKDGKIYFQAGGSIAFMIVKDTPMSDAAVEKIPDKYYTGKAITPEPSVSCNGRKLIKGKDYTVTYKNNIAVGRATITLTGTGVYTGTKTVTFNILKVVPKLKAVNKKIKRSSLKKKSRKLKVFTLKNAYGSVKYKKVKGSKYLGVTSSGKIKVKKKTPKGKYSIKVKIKVKSTDKNKAKTFTKTVKIKVK